MAPFRFLVITAAIVDATSITQADNSFTKSVTRRLSHGIRRLQDMEEAVTACSAGCEGVAALLTQMAGQGDEAEMPPMSCSNIEMLTCLMTSQACAPLVSAAAADQGLSDAEAAAEAAAAASAAAMMEAFSAQCSGDTDAMAAAISRMAATMVSAECQAACVGWVDALSAMFALEMGSMETPGDASPSEGPSSGPSGPPEDTNMMQLVCNHKEAHVCYRQNAPTVCNMEVEEGEDSAQSDPVITDALSRCDAWRVSNPSLSNPAVGIEGAGNNGGDSAATSVSALGTVSLALLVVCAAS